MATIISGSKALKAHALCLKIFVDSTINRPDLACRIALIYQTLYDNTYIISVIVYSIMCYIIYVTPVGH